MQITFMIKEKTSDIITNLKKLAKETQFINGIGYEQDRYNENRIFLVCEDFGNNESGSATVKILGEDALEVTTAFSRFKYYFQGNSVTYFGAYRGFLSQNLLPNFTPIINGNELVYSSMFFSGITLLKYAEFQEKFVNLKDQNGGMSHYHTHPWHVEQLLAAKEDSEVTATESAAEEYPQ